MANVHGPMSSATPAEPGISKAIRPYRKIRQVLMLAALALAAGAPARAQLEMIGGTLEIFVADDFDNDYAFNLYGLRTDSGELLELVDFVPPPGVGAGARLLVQGERSGARLMVDRFTVTAPAPLPCGARRRRSRARLRSSSFFSAGSIRLPRGP